MDSLRKLVDVEPLCLGALKWLKKASDPEKDAYKILTLSLG